MRIRKTVQDPQGNVFHRTISPDYLFEGQFFRELLEDTTHKEVEQSSIYSIETPTHIRLDNELADPWSSWDWENTICAEPLFESSNGEPY